MGHTKRKKSKTTCMKELAKRKGTMKLIENNLIYRFTKYHSGKEYLRLRKIFRFQ